MVSFLYFLLVWGKANFAPSLDNISGLYATGLSQVFSSLVVIVCASTLLFWKTSYFLSLPRKLVPFLFLFVYAIFTSIWSPTPEKSFVLATFNLVDVIWAIVIAKICLKDHPENYFKNFLVLFGMICISDFCATAIHKGFSTNLDEMALISFLVAFILHREYKLYLFPFILFCIGILGNSVSAILALCFGLILYFYKYNKRTLILFSLTTITLGYIILNHLSSGDITLYGKDIGLILTGSGRFNAYKAVWFAILEADPTKFIFGHGYATDRTVLFAIGHTWTVDVHNNFLHIFYGLGFIGVLIFAFSCAMSFFSISTTNFKTYRILVLASLFSFGVTSSYFFGRPSFSGVFWLSYVILGSVMFLNRRQEH